MQITQGNTLLALRGVQAFLDAHADRLGPVATSGARKKLDAQVNEVSSHVMTQSESNLDVKGATQKQYALRYALFYGHMAPVARIAAADLPDTPELDALRLPKASVSTETLFAAAVGMANAAEKHAAVFVDGGLPADFLVQFRAAADAMQASLDARMQSQGARNGATKGLVTAVRRARKTVRVIDSIVRFALKDDEPLLRSWDTVKRPPTKTGKATGSATPASPAIPSAPTAPTAPASPAAPLALVTTQP